MNTVQGIFNLITVTKKTSLAPSTGSHKWCVNTDLCLICTR